MFLAFLKKHVVMILLILTVMSACASGTGSKAEAFPETIESLQDYYPVPELTPREVVRIQMAALKANDGEDTGIALAFRFASPRNRLLTGGLENFASIVRREDYAPMLESLDFTLGPVDLRGELAIVAVRTYRPAGESAGYLFILTRQSGGIYNDCWMTDGVFRVEIDGGSDANAAEYVDA